MAFTSLSYFFFLPVVFLIFYFTADRWRWLVLLTASYSFYATLKAPHLPAVLFMVTCISYAFGLRIATQQDEALRRRWFQSGIFISVAILALLKYLPFLETHSTGTSLTRGLVTIGVSYYIFQAISYLTDIYLETEEPEKHFGRYALYLAFFPKLLQGPIERAGDLLPQLRKQYVFDYYAMRSGMILCTWGLFKKVVIADRLALYADQVFNNVHHYSGLSLIIGAYTFALQIFFDFSAYTDIARGTGSMFGINLTENFNTPYLATSVADFWRRWHISFSHWIMDYIFKPLQMELRDWRQTGTAVALVITFLISGIWHGATYGFLIWGLLHGVYLAVSIYYRPYQKRLYKYLGIEKCGWVTWWQICVTFNLVCFAWVFFRANSFADMCYITGNIFNFQSNLQLIHTTGFSGFAKGYILMKQHASDAVVVVAVLAFYAAVSKYQYQALSERPSWYRWSCYYLLIAGILFLGIFDASKFIYFSF